MKEVTQGTSPETEVAIKIDIRKKSLYQEKELGEDAEARSHRCSAASQQLRFRVHLRPKIRLKLNPFL